MRTRRAATAYWSTSASGTVRSFVVSSCSCSLHVMSFVGPSVKYVTLFLANFDSPPLSHFVNCHTSRDSPKVRHTSLTLSIFSRPSTKTHRAYKAPVGLQILTQLFVGFLSGVLSKSLLSGRFCRFCL